MRKEFSQARFLSIAQNQLLRAHDELRMSISRMKLKDKDDEPSEVNIVTREELIPYNVKFTSDKFVSLSSLARIRASSGTYRYLRTACKILLWNFTFRSAIYISCFQILPHFLIVVVRTRILVKK
jgi:E3 ubiquitin-protein ligase SHPRH